MSSFNPYTKLSECSPGPWSGSYAVALSIWDSREKVSGLSDLPHPIWEEVSHCKLLKWMLACCCSSSSLKWQFTQKRKFCHFLLNLISIFHGAQGFHAIMNKNSFLSYNKDKKSTMKFFNFSVQMFSGYTISVLTQSFHLASNYLKYRNK